MIVVMRFNAMRHEVLSRYATALLMTNFTGMSYLRR